MTASKRPRSEGPNVPIAPMLDMAFQLLTFFVLTYRAAPVEGQFVMNLLPAQPATASRPPRRPTRPPRPTTFPARCGPCRRSSGPARAAAWPGSMIEQNEVPNDPGRSSRSLYRYFHDPDLPFDQTLIKVDPKLRYSELMTVINAFSNAFVARQEGAEAELHRARPRRGGVTDHGLERPPSSGARSSPGC